MRFIYLHDDSRHTQRMTPITSIRKTSSNHFNRRSPKCYHLFPQTACFACAIDSTWTCYRSKSLNIKVWSAIIIIVCNFLKMPTGYISTERITTIRPNDSPSSVGSHNEKTTPLRVPFATWKRCALKKESTRILRKVRKISSKLFSYVSRFCFQYLHWVAFHKDRDWGLVLLYLAYSSVIQKQTFHFQRTCIFKLPH